VYKGGDLRKEMQITAAAPFKTRIDPYITREPYKRGEDEVRKVEKKRLPYRQWVSSRRCGKKQCVEGRAESNNKEVQEETRESDKSYCGVMTRREGESE